MIRYFISYSYFVDGLIKNGNAEVNLKRNIIGLIDVEELQSMIEGDLINKCNDVVKNSVKVINFIKL